MGTVVFVLGVDCDVELSAPAVGPFHANVGAIAPSARNAGTERIEVERKQDGAISNCPGRLSAIRQATGTQPADALAGLLDDTRLSVSGLLKHADRQYDLF